MSEAMSLETMTKYLAELEGNYHTATRVPFYNKITAKGKPKDGKQAGDLDVVGICNSKTRRFLVAECKGHGSPENYETWFIPTKLKVINYLIDSIVKDNGNRNIQNNNINKILDPIWDKEFELHEKKVDEFWLIISGSFYPKSNPENWKSRNLEFIEKMWSIGKKYYNDSNLSPNEIENILLEEAEKYYNDKKGITVRIIPIHKLIEKLIICICKDMLKRRKRYPDTALELIRWLVRTTWANIIDLEKLGNEIRKIRPV